MTDPFPRIGPRVEAEPISVEVPNLPPVAEFTSSDVSGTGSNPAHTESFTDQSTDSDGTIVSRVWDYGDTGAPTKPTAKFTSTTSGLTASLTDKSTAPAGASINAWDWDFGDGTTPHDTRQNPTHTYAAGGGYPVKLTVTDSNGTVSNPVQHTVTVSSSGGGTGTGRMFGYQAGWSTGSTPETSDTSRYNCLSGPDSPSNIISRIAYAKDHGLGLKLILTGGQHSQYMATSGDVQPSLGEIVGQFSFRKWKDKVDTFLKGASGTRQADIRDAITAGVTNDSVKGIDMMDEPGNHTLVKGWGPIITRALLDDMADYIHSFVPTCPAGVWMPHGDVLSGDPAKFQKVDFAVDSYSWRKGDLVDGTGRANWLQEAKDYADAQNLPYVLAINPINGGFKPIDNCSVTPGDARYDIYCGCPLDLTGGSGTSEATASANCAMTSTQYRDYAKAILAVGACIVWRWDSGYMSATSPGNRTGLTVIEAERAIKTYADTKSDFFWSKRL